MAHINLVTGEIEPGVAEPEVPSLSCSRTLSFSSPFSPSFMYLNLPYSFLITGTPKVAAAIHDLDKRAPSCLLRKTSIPIQKFLFLLLSFLLTCVLFPFLGDHP